MSRLLGVRVSDSEHDEIHTSARSHGMDASAFTRATTLARVRKLRRVTQGETNPRAARVAVEARLLLGEVEEASQRRLTVRLHCDALIALLADVVDVIEGEGNADR